MASWEDDAELVPDWEAAATPVSSGSWEDKAVPVKEKSWREKIYDWAKRTAEAEEKARKETPFKYAVDNLKAGLGFTPLGMTAHFGGDLLKTAGGLARWGRDRMAQQASDTRDVVANPSGFGWSRSGAAPNTVKTSSDAAAFLKKEGAPDWLVDAPEALSGAGKASQDFVFNPDTLSGKVGAPLATAVETLVPGGAATKLLKLPAAAQGAYWGLRGFGHAYDEQAAAGRPIADATKYAKGQGTIDAGASMLPISRLGESAFSKLIGEAATKKMPWLPGALTTLPEAELFTVAQNSLERNAGTDKNRSLWDQSNYLPNLAFTGGLKVAGHAMRPTPTDPMLRYANGPEGELFPVTDATRGVENAPTQLAHAFRWIKQQITGNNLADYFKAEQIAKTHDLGPEVAERHGQILDELAANYYAKQKGLEFPFPERGLNEPVFDTPQENALWATEKQVIADKYQRLKANKEGKGEKAADFNPYQSSHLVVNYEGPEKPGLSDVGKQRKMFAFTGEPDETDYSYADESGKPVVVYHGTGKSFSKFVVGHPEQHDAGWLGEGVSVTTNPETAGMYAEAKAGPFNETGNAQVMPFKLGIRNPYKATLAEKYAIADIEAKFGREAAQKAAAEWTAKLKAKGHDAIYSPDDQEYTIFDPAHLKPALIPNSGAAPERIIAGLEGTRTALSGVPGGDETLTLKRTTLNKVLAPLFDAHKKAHRFLVDRLGDMADEAHAQQVSDAEGLLKSASDRIDAFEADRAKLEALAERQGGDPRAGVPQGSEAYQQFRKTSIGVTDAALADAKTRVAQLAAKIEAVKRGTAQGMGTTDYTEAHAEAQKQVEDLTAVLEKLKKLPGMPTSADEKFASDIVTPEEMELHDQAIDAAHKSFKSALADYQHASGLRGKVLAAQAAQLGMFNDPAAVAALSKIKTLGDVIGKTAMRFGSVPGDIWQGQTPEGRLYTRGLATRSESAGQTGLDYLTNPLHSDLQATIGLGNAIGNRQQQEAIARFFGRQDRGENGTENAKLTEDVKRRFPGLRDVPYFPKDIAAELYAQAAPSYTKADQLAGLNDWFVRQGFRLFPFGHAKNEMVHFLDTVGDHPLEAVRRLGETRQMVENLNGGDLTPEMEDLLRAGMKTMGQEPPHRRWLDLIGLERPEQPGGEGNRWLNPANKRFIWDMSDAMRAAATQTRAAHDNTALPEAVQETARTLPDYTLAPGDPGFADFYRSTGMRAVGNFNPYTSNKLKAVGAGLGDMAHGDPRAWKGATLLAALYALKRNTADEGLSAITGHDVQLGMGGPTGLVETGLDFALGHLAEGFGKGVGEAVHFQQPINAALALSGMANTRFGKGMLNPNDDVDRNEALLDGRVGDAAHIGAVQARELVRGVGASSLFGFQPAFSVLTERYDPLEGLMRAMGIIKSAPISADEAYQRNKRNRSLPLPAGRQEIIPNEER